MLKAKTSSDSSKGYPKGIFDSYIYNTNHYTSFLIGNMTLNFQDPVGLRKIITVSCTPMDIYLVYLLSFRPKFL